MLVELEFAVFPIAVHPELQIAQRIRSQNIHLLEVRLRDLALDVAALVLEIEIIHQILTKIQSKPGSQFQSGCPHKFPC